MSTNTMMLMRTARISYGGTLCNVLFGLTIACFLIVSIVSGVHDANANYRFKPTRWDTADGSSVAPRTTTGDARFAPERLTDGQVLVCDALPDVYVVSNRSVVTLKYGMFVSLVDGRDAFVKYDEHVAKLRFEETTTFDSGIGEHPFATSNCVCFDDATAVSVKAYEGRLRVTRYDASEESVNMTITFDVKCNANPLHTTSLSTLCLSEGRIQIFYVTSGVFKAVSVNLDESSVDWMLDLDDDISSISNPAYSIKTKTTRIASFNGSRLTLSLYKLARRRGNVLETTRLIVPSGNPSDAYERVFKANHYAYNPRLYATMSTNDEESLALEYYGSTFLLEEKYDKTRFYDAFSRHVDRSGKCHSDSVPVSINPFEIELESTYCFGFGEDGALSIVRTQTGAIQTSIHPGGTPVSASKFKIKDRFVFVLGNVHFGCKMLILSESEGVDNSKTLHTTHDGVCTNAGLDERFVFLVNAEGRVCVVYQ